MADPQRVPGDEDDPERAVVIACVAPGRGDQDFAELTELLRTARTVIVGCVTQRRARPHPRTYLGSGKISELERAVADTDAEVVVCDDDLAPAQQHALEDRLEVRVVDRTGVILDIFASHAHTAEGKLQVELAQLEYNLQRMRGLWRHLERLGGGVGTRGPGETQLESDRRLARERIALIRRRLSRVRRHRATTRKRRVQSSTPSVALAGYTNVGKSTLLNALTGSRISTADRMFETLDATTRSYTFAGRAYTITDTVGFIRKLPHNLVEAFASTLEETLSGNLLLLVTDAGVEQEERSSQVAACLDVLEEIGALDIPRMLVVNKCDLASSHEQQRIANAYPDAVLVSARTGSGLAQLEQRIAEFFADRFQAVTLLVPYSDGAALRALYALGAPIERRDTELGIVIHAHLPAAEARRFTSLRLNAATQQA